MAEIAKKASAAVLALGILATPIVAFVNKFESGNKVDTVAYVDKIGHNQPTTFCAGLTEGIVGFKVKVGQVFTVDECKRLEGVVIQKEAIQVEKIVKVPISVDQMVALVDFTHNLGIGVLQKSSIIKNLNAGQCKKAADSFLLYKYGTVNGKKVVLRGLEKRRKAEREMFIKDC